MCPAITPPFIALSDLKASSSNLFTPSLTRSHTGVYKQVSVYHRLDFAMTEQCFTQNERTEMLHLCFFCASFVLFCRWSKIFARFI